MKKYIIKIYYPGKSFYFGGYNEDGKTVKMYGFFRSDLVKMFENEIEAFCISGELSALTGHETKVLNF